MTQEELRSKLNRTKALKLAKDEFLPSSEDVLIDEIIDLINQYVKELIGVDDQPIYSKVGESTTEVLGTRTRNELRDEQRKRAGLNE